jgi:hypothetical protein
MNQARVLIWALTLIGVAIHAETLSIPLRAGPPAEFTLDSPLDDSDFADPRGYLRHGATTRHFIQKLTLTNTGDVPLNGPLLVVNRGNWSSAEALRASLALPAQSRALMERLFTFWRDHISHAGSGCEGLKEPLALLNFWGYALCGDTTSALTRLATDYGVPARKIPLNGHVAAEYFYDDAWHILDADQNVCYLRLDNQTLASAADLRADPFLALRTKVSGRHALPKPEAMAFNTSLHEYLEPKEEKVVKLKQPLAPVRTDTLFPGEQMIVHATEPPEQAVGRADLKRWGAVRETALRVVEWRIDPAVRRSANGRVTVATGYPILRAVNHTTGEIVVPPAGEVTFEIMLQPRGSSDRISVYCQRSRASLPLPGKGRNSVLLAAGDARGAAKLDVEWDKPTAVTAPNVAPSLVNAAPTFRIRADAGTDALWWQVSGANDFAFVPPNFDAVIAPAETLHFDPRAATFLNPREPYFLRIKARRNGVWCEWSAPLAFQVEKPARPAPVTAIVVGGKLRLKWPDAGAGAEYLVFGSNRIDFVPEPFAEEEIVAMREQTVELVRPNKNLIAVVAKPEIELEPTARFYRIIARRGGALSVPGDLIVTPPSLAANLPPAQVLQTRWRFVDGVDEYLARETPLR